MLSRKEWCLLCGKGNWSSAGAAVCSRCAAGRAANAVGASACGDCEAGRFTCLGGMIRASLAWYSRDRLRYISR